MSRQFADAGTVSYWATAQEAVQPHADDRNVPWFRMQPTELVPLVDGSVIVGISVAKLYPRISPNPMSVRPVFAAPLVAIRQRQAFGPDRRDP